MATGEQPAISRAALDTPVSRALHRDQMAITNWSLQPAASEPQSGHERPLPRGGTTWLLHAILNSNLHSELEQAFGLLIGELLSG